MKNFLLSRWEVDGHLKISCDDDAKECDRSKVEQCRGLYEHSQGNLKHLPHQS